jgi:hypothetical protein
MRTSLIHCQTALQKELNGLIASKPALTMQKAGT